MRHLMEGSFVILKSSEEEGWVRESARVIDIDPDYHGHPVITVELFDHPDLPLIEGDDGLREITEDQIDVVHHPKCFELHKVLTEFFEAITDDDRDLVQWYANELDALLNRWSKDEDWLSVFTAELFHVVDSYVVDYR